MCPIFTRFLGKLLMVKTTRKKKHSMVMRTLCVLTVLTDKKVIKFHTFFIIMSVQSRQKLFDITTAKAWARLTFIFYIWKMFVIICKSKKKNITKRLQGLPGLNRKPGGKLITGRASTLLTLITWHLKISSMPQRMIIVAIILYCTWIYTHGGNLYSTVVVMFTITPS